MEVKQKMKIVFFNKVKKNNINDNSEKIMKSFAKTIQLEVDLVDA